jgi:hypothetical protein
MRRPLPLTGFLIIALGTSLAAQQATPTFEPWEAPSSPLARVQFGATSRSDSLLAPRRDYRYEGLLVGGLSLGLAGAWAAVRYQGPVLSPQVPRAAVTRLVPPWRSACLVRWLVVASAISWVSPRRGTA